MHPSLLNGAFALFSSTRLLTNLPILWAIYSSGDSSQHSLQTWLAWVGSHTTMAAWLDESKPPLRSSVTLQPDAELTARDPPQPVTHQVAPAAPQCL